LIFCPVLYITLKSKILKEEFFQYCPKCPKGPFPAEIGIYRLSETPF
jgi:hypothetical protein